MKLEKKHWIIIGVVVAIILVWYFFLRKKAESGYNTASACRKLGCTGYKNGRCTGCRLRSETTTTTGTTGESSYRTNRVTRGKGGIYDGAGQLGKVSSSGVIGCPEWQTWNPITKRCENRSYPDGALRVSGTSGVGVGVVGTGGLSRGTPIPGSNGMCCQGTLSAPDPVTGTQWCNGGVGPCRGATTTA